MVLDRALVADDDLDTTIADCISAGVDWIQTRDRTLAGTALMEWNDRVARAIASGGSASLIVNRRVDVALCCNAAGVHLGFDGMNAADARSLMGEDKLIGKSLHAPEEFRQPDLAYAHLAPIATPLSKPATRPPLGFGAIEAAAKHGTPVIAQGGLDAQNAGLAIRAGAQGIAVTGAILKAIEPARATRALRESLDA